jgi:hypothetical protein
VLVLARDDGGLGMAACTGTARPRVAATIIFKLVKRD